MCSMKISVAMATYNSRKYILSQLDSIVKQTVSVDEVVFCDDCSSDGTADVIEDFIKENNLNNWKVVRNEKNVGFSKNFTKAISLTTGDVVVLCDHDDLWVENKIEIITKTFLDNPNVLALGTSFVRIDENGQENPIKLLWGHSNNNLIRRRVKKGALVPISVNDVAVFNIAPGCCCAFRSCLKQDFLAIDSSMPHDWKVNFIAALKNGLYYLDVITTKYRIYSKNTIGLVHQTSLEKRILDCKKNLTEKKEMIECANYFKASGTIIQYLKNLVAVFDERILFLQAGFSFRRFISLLWKSRDKKGLWESILTDALTIMKK